VKVGINGNTVEMSCLLREGGGRRVLEWQCPPHPVPVFFLLGGGRLEPDYILQACPRVCGLETILPPNPPLPPSPHLQSWKAEYSNGPGDSRPDIWRSLVLSHHLEESSQGAAWPGTPTWDYFLGGKWTLMSQGCSLQQLVLPDSHRWLCTACGCRAHPHLLPKPSLDEHHRSICFHYFYFFVVFKENT
jgi:hypothetical protein